MKAGEQLAAMEMMAIDPNWEQVLFEALGIFLFETEWGVDFYSPCCNNGIEIFEACLEYNWDVPDVHARKDHAITDGC